MIKTELVLTNSLLKIYRWPTVISSFSGVSSASRVSSWYLQAFYSFSPPSLGPSNACPSAVHDMRDDTRAPTSRTPLGLPHIPRHSTSSKLIPSDSSVSSVPSTSLHSATPAMHDGIRRHRSDQQDDPPLPCSKFAFHSCGFRSSLCTAVEVPNYNPHIGLRFGFFQGRP